MSLLDKMNKKTKLEGAATMSKSQFMKDQTYVSTSCPMLNVACSGKLDGGYGPGLFTLAGPSRHFKSNLGLFMAKEYLDKFEDAFILFYDSEYGASSEYFDTFGIDPERVAHRPIDDIEDIKIDLSQMLEAMKEEEKATGKKQRVFIFVDSVGNLASRKETEDALDGKTVADMTRAKSLKSLFRIVTPKLNKRDIPMFVVNHTYDEIASGPGAPKKVISGGTGVMYSSNTAFIIGRRVIKDGKEVEGYSFILNTEKSRSIKEKSAVPLNVTFEGGIDLTSGLLEVAKPLGYIEYSHPGWYSRPQIEGDKKVRKDDTKDINWWKPILEDPAFKQAVYELYSLSSHKIVSMGEEDESVVINDDEKDDEQIEYDEYDDSGVPEELED